MHPLARAALDELRTLVEMALVRGSQTASLVTNAFIQLGNSFAATAVMGTKDANILRIITNNTARAEFDTSGNFVPPADNTGQVGTNARRWSLVRATTVTTGDLELLGEDGTAHWVLKEHSGAIFAKNHKTGLVHRFLMEEVKDGDLPPDLGTFVNNPHPGAAHDAEVQRAFETAEPSLLADHRWVHLEGVLILMSGDDQHFAVVHERDHGAAYEWETVVLPHLHHALDRGVSLHLAPLSGRTHLRAAAMTAAEQGVMTLHERVNAFVDAHTEALAKEADMALRAEEARVQEEERARAIEEAGRAAEAARLAAEKEAATTAETIAAPPDDSALPETRPELPPPPPDSNKGEPS